MISALVVFNVEPDSFGNFFDAIYWATVSLTTVGYCDIYPLSGAGRVVTMLSSILGIAVVALPAGIITAGYMDKLQKKDTVWHSTVWPTSAVPRTTGDTETTSGGRSRSSWCSERVPCSVTC